MAKAIADKLQAKLTGQEEQIVTTKPTDNTEAYDAYLRGLAYMLKGGIAATEKSAQKYFREAVTIRPEVRNWLGAAVLCGCI